MKNKKQTIAVGISGGVDSSVAAYLLKEQGYNVIGIFVKTWSPEWLPCTWVDEKRDAMRVCAKLGIPFYFLDATDEYKQGVADYMIGEYAKGRTPNPDVLCNRVVKFGAMWRFAQSLGADALATGHYARLLPTIKEGGQARVEYGNLFRGVDEAKDQSYFLWMLTKEELQHVLFPIGHLQKKEVRSIAEKAGLTTATKKDSQGVCFLGDIDMREFLSHYIEQKKGDVVNPKGVVIGTHDGVWFYTLGERHGFTITAHDTNRKPYYVIGKNIEENKLIVDTTPRSMHQLGKIIVHLRDAVVHMPLQHNMQCQAQIRYHGSIISANVIASNTRHISVALVYDQVVPLGQSLVLYDNDMVIGAGIIDEILPEA